VSERNSFVRSLHDLGLAAWFGGTLAGAVALNGASGDVGDPKERLRVANSGWDRWTPVNAAAIGTHLVGDVGILLANRKRAAGQKGVLANTVAKSVVTGAALAATGYSRVLGRKLHSHDATPVEGATVPTGSTPGDAASAQQQLRVLQWALPVLTGVVVVLNAVHGEQQRPGQQLSGFVERAVRLVA
jgi:hypothetical protein